MMQKFFFRTAFFVLLLIANFSIAPVKAQTADCKFDLSSVSALLVQAQAKWSGGDQAGANALIKQIQTQLAEIEARCGTSQPTDFKLTQNYTSKNGRYTLKYPGAWIVTPADTSTSGSDNPAILFAANQATVALITKNTKTTEDVQGVVVLVGTATELVRQYGRFDSAKDYTKMDAKELLSAIVTASSNNSANFKEIQPVNIAGKEAFESSFASTSANSIPFDGLLLIVPLSNNQFAALVGLTNSGQGTKIEAFTQAFAATVQLG